MTNSFLKNYPMNVTVIVYFAPSIEVSCVWLGTTLILLCRYVIHTISTV